jgi:UDP-glucose 4-epimerase
MRILITGIAGFIGSSIARAALLRDDEVIGIDNCSTGSLHNLEPILGSIRFLEGDVRDAALLRRACRSVDCIFHLAGTMSAQQFVKSPAEARDVDLVGTQRVLTAALAAKVRRVIFASTAEVYGEGFSPHRETSPSRPASSFGSRKMAAEQLLLDAWQIDGIETVRLRYFNLFGPGQSGSLPHSPLIAKFVRQALCPELNDPPIIYGDGEQTRDFVFIDDAVAGTLAASIAPALRVAGKAFNIGSGVAHTVNQVAELMARQPGRKFYAEHAEAREGDIRHLEANIGRAHEAFGYLPATSLQEGLDRTIAWFRSEAKPTPRSPAGALPLSSADTLRNREQNGLVIDLTEAIECGNLDLVFQPIISLKSERISGAEALIRWRNRGKNIPPRRFIPLAEHARLIDKLGTWAIRHACKALAQFSTSCGNAFRVAVNVSPSQLETEELPGLIERALKESHLAGGQLEIEITERVQVHSWARAMESLERIQGLGVSVALDHFGIKHPGMEMLSRLPLTRIKIDRAINAAAPSNPRLLEGIVAMANQLGVEVVANCMETSRQLERARAAGCDEAQGLFIARPGSIQSVMDLATVDHRVA